MTVGALCQSDQDWDNMELVETSRAEGLNDIGMVWDAQWVTRTTCVSGGIIFDSRLDSRCLVRIEANWNLSTHSNSKAAPWVCHRSV